MRGRGSFKARYESTDCDSSSKKSNVRKKIAEYLFEISPNYSYTAEIAYHVRTTPSNVIGAIRGMDDRYKEDESLLNLDIVQEKSCGNNVRLYGITDFGKDLIKP